MDRGCSTPRDRGVGFVVGLGSSAVAVAPTRIGHQCRERGPLHPHLQRRLGHLVSYRPRSCPQQRCHPEGSARSCHPCSVLVSTLFTLERILFSIVGLAALYLSMACMLLAWSSRVRAVAVGQSCQPSSSWTGGSPAPLQAPVSRSLLFGHPWPTWRPPPSPQARAWRWPRHDLDSDTIVVIVDDTSAVSDASVGPDARRYD